ncbi:MAG: hypothetical protein IJM96_01690 [Clostridia bacterium]|nr:hypothetical protein [Clostridia bacterium]MBQ7086174.1 hypothetical protein [Clostridia bacterium]
MFFLIIVPMLLPPMACLYWFCRSLGRFIMAYPDERWTSYYLTPLILSSIPSAFIMYYIIGIFNGSISLM